MPAIHLSKIDPHVPHHRPCVQNYRLNYTAGIYLVDKNTVCVLSGTIPVSIAYGPTRPTYFRRLAHIAFASTRKLGKEIIDVPDIPCRGRQYGLLVDVDPPTPSTCRVSESKGFQQYGIPQFYIFWQIRFIKIQPTGRTAHKYGRYRVA